MIELKIDQEFKEKIPPMPQEDFDGLRTDILRDGYVRDPLVVWKEENILLDGHHRWAVIQDNADLLGDKFNVDYKSFPDRWAAIAWICANQLHKHNMDKIQRQKLIQEEYEAQQKTQGGTGANQYTVSKLQSGENFHSAKQLNKTRDLIAKEHNISPGAVKTAVEVGRGIDRAAEVVPEFKREVLSGAVKANNTELAAIRKLKNDDDVKAAVDSIKNKKVHFPSGNQTSSKAEAFEPQISRDRDAVVEYTIDDFLEELGLVIADCQKKIRRMLDMHSALVSENTAEIVSVLDDHIKEIEKMEEM